MSLLANHGVIGGVWLIPSLISRTAATQSGTTFTITPLVTPTSGNLIVILSGGTQTRTTVTPPTGFTEESTAGGGSGTSKLFWKVAGGSEPANYTIDWSGTLNGGIAIIEYSNADTNSPIGMHIGANAIGTSAALPSHSITTPGVTLTYIAKSGTSVWSADNSYTNITPSGEFRYATKTYNAVATGQNVSWSGTSETVNADLVLIKGKLI